jgi:hypothetical protein
MPGSACLPAGTENDIIARLTALLMAFISFHFYFAG